MKLNADTMKSILVRGSDSLKGTVLNHKKKIIFVSVIFLLGYVGKKKLKFTHLFILI
jgi:hypothetical protein